jgi:hypothetical protein
MIVLRYGQFVAALEAASFEHFAPIVVSVARTETMHTQTSTNFGLICPLRHYNTFLSKLIELKLTNGNYTPWSLQGQTSWAKLGG